MKASHLSSMPDSPDIKTSKLLGIASIGEDGPKKFASAKFLGNSSPKAEGDGVGTNVCCGDGPEVIDGMP